MGQINLPNRLNFQTTARDLEYETALKKIVYPTQVPTPFYYPRSQYGVTGLGTNCIPYDYYGFLQAWGVETCNQTDVIAQYACTQRNAPKLAAIGLLSPSYGTCITPDMIPGPYTPSAGSAGDTSGGGGLIYVPTGGGQPIYYPPTPAPTYGGSTPPATTPPATTTPALTYSPSLTFTPSRQGTLYPGDTWTLRITGGKPNAVVTVAGTQNGVSNTNSMGVSDANGNFTLQGTIDTSSIGSWFEVWYVGGQMAGTFQFNVAATPGAPSSTPIGTSPPPNSGSPVPGTTTTPPANTSTATGMIFGVPENYVMMGGAALLFLLVMGGRR